MVFIISLVKGQCPVDGGRYERDVTEESSAPKWLGWRDVPRVVLHRPHLRKTAIIALVVDGRAARESPGIAGSWP